MREQKTTGGENLLGPECSRNLSEMPYNEYTTVKFFLFTKCSNNFLELNSQFPFPVAIVTS
jgi:hypothetical protein